MDGKQKPAVSVMFQAGKKKKSMVDFNLTLANISTAEEIEDIEYTLHIYDYDSFETIDEVVISNP